MNVFISHSFTDARLAKRVADKLKDHGFHVWDETQVLPGENWAESLSQALESSDAMVVLLTPNSVKSTNLSHEIGYALGKKQYKGRLIPVMAAPPEQFNASDIPWVFKHKPFQMIQVPHLDTDEASIQKIAQALQAVA